MPVFHFTLHAYRSWNTDNERGYIQREKTGVQPRNEPLADARDSLASFPPVRFTQEDCVFLVEQAHDVIARRDLQLYAATAIETHLHLVASWRDPRHEDDIQARLKQGFGFILAKAHGTKGRPYFSRGGLPEKVETPHHLRYLLYEYFPKHNAPMWCKALE